VPGTKEWLTDVALGRIPGYSVVHKFGTGTLTTALAPVCASGFYRTPTAATALEFVSTSADDAANGSGAREVTVTGLGASWSQVSQTVATNGTTAAPLLTDLVRLHRWYVSKSGTYATQTAASHAGTLKIQAAGGSDLWSSIGLVGGLGRGQSQIGAFTIPASKTGWLMSYNISVATTKSCDFYFFQRPNANDTSAPYTGTMRIVRSLVGVAAPWEPLPKMPDGPFVGPCDVGFLGKVTSTGTAEASVDFELLLVDA